MRGEDTRDGLFSYLEARVPADHPLRAIRVLVDEALAALSGDFERLYWRTGRPSIAPEKLLRALRRHPFGAPADGAAGLQPFVPLASVCRWTPVWDATVYSKNRDRLVAGDVAARFLQAVLRGAGVRRLLSDEHFSVDGTLIEAWASMKSFRPKDGGDEPPAGRNAGRTSSGRPMRPSPTGPAVPQGGRPVEPAVHLLMENANGSSMPFAMARRGKGRRPPRPMTWPPSSMPCALAGTSPSTAACPSSASRARAG